MQMQVEIPRRATNLSARPELLRRAKALNINLSATFERALEAEVKARERAQWLEENGPAMVAYNQRVAEQGTFSDGIRSF